MLTKRHYLALALWFTLFANGSFFSQVSLIYPFSTHWGFVASLAVLLFAVIILFLLLTCWGRVGFYTAALWLMSSAVAAYFMDTYSVVIDKAMLENALLTHTGEALDLLSLRLVAYVVFLGLLPIGLLRWWLRRRSTSNGPMRWATRTWRDVKNKGMLFLLASALLALAVAPNTQAYASFFREHKLLRFYTNPLTPVYGSARLALVKLGYGLPKPRQVLDAAIVRQTQGRAPRLMVLVVGETARADHFGLNGYARNTTPQLAQKNVVSMRQVSACGTSTAESLPCMFSYLGETDYSIEKAKEWDNALDLLAKTGVRVLWRDNNQDSKGVAEGRSNIQYENYRLQPPNTVCDPECRDRGMLVGLNDWLAQAPQARDVLIVLHQMGSHGPAYYKRYSKQHALFQPECQTNMLEQCGKEQVVNAFDNTIVATDDFLARTIDWLEQERRRDPERDSALIYVSDHGESLGENGVYLHGLPKLLAPKAQTHVPMVLWSSRAENLAAWRAAQDKPITHDVLFHSMLGYFTLKPTRPDLYQSALDLFAYKP